PGAYKSSDNDPIFILKFEPQGKLQFAASFSGPVLSGPVLSYGVPVHIAVDPSGSVVLTGTTASNLPVVDDPDPQSNDCDAKTTCMAFVASLDSTGSVLQYARLLGHGVGDKLTFGVGGEVYVAGHS